MSTKAAEGASVLESDPALRDDMIAARQTARRFLKSQREHPRWLSAQTGPTAPSPWNGRC